MWRTKLDICLWLVKSSITKMATKSLGGYGKMVKSVTIVKGLMISLLAVISLSSFASAMLALQMGFDATILPSQLMMYSLNASFFCLPRYFALC